MAYNTCVCGSLSFGDGASLNTLKCLNLTTSTECASIPPALREWLYATDSNNVLVRELDDLRVSLGPNNNSFFAHDGKSYKWSNLPSGLNAAIQQRRGSSGGWADAPRLVCLGADESYIMATEGGGGSWKLDNYRSLRECIDIIKDRDEQLSLIQVCL